MISRKPHMLSDRDIAGIKFTTQIAGHFDADGPGKELLLSVRFIQGEAKVAYGVYSHPTDNGLDRKEEYWGFDLRAAQEAYNNLP